MALSDTWLKANNGKKRASLEEHSDRDGLGVRVTPRGKITFQLRYRYGGTAKRLDLGTYPLMSLKEARAEAQRRKGQLEQGHDPKVVRILEKQAILKADSVESLFRQWHEAYCTKNKKGHHDILRSFELHVFPKIGKLPADKVTLHEWLDLLEKQAEIRPGITDRSFARDHDIKLPPGYEKSQRKGQETLYEREQKRQTGLSKADHMRLVTEAWQASDNARSFVQALAERGYVLATGKRPYLLVDAYGGVNALPKLIDDKSVRTADVRAFLEKDYPPESLPSAEEAQALVEKHRTQIERELRKDEIADQIAQLKHAQQHRRETLLRDQQTQRKDHHAARVAQQSAQRAERDALRAGYLKAVRDVRLARHRDRPTGLAAFLGRVTGIERLREALHRRADAKRLEQYDDELKALKAGQEVERQRLDLRHTLQTKDLARKTAALDKVDRREMAALLRDARTTERVLSRGGDDAMPSLAKVAGLETDAGTRHAPDARAAFEQASEERPPEFPDLLAAFSRAAKSRDGDGSSDSASSALDRARPPDPTRPDGPDKGRGRGQ